MHRVICTLVIGGEASLGVSNVIVAYDSITHLGQSHKNCLLPRPNLFRSLIFLFVPLPINLILVACAVG